MPDVTSPDILFTGGVVYKLLPTACIRARFQLA